MNEDSDFDSQQRTQLLLSHSVHTQHKEIPKYVIL